MSEQTPEANAEKRPFSVVDTIFDLATAWAVVGLRAAKTALEESARALDKTAKTLDTVASRVESPIDEQRPSHA